MKVIISNGKKENGEIVGNNFNKYYSNNLIINFLMSSFEKSLDDLVNKASAETIHEIGCGEGLWVIKWHQKGFQVRGTDHSPLIIELASCNAKSFNIYKQLFKTRSIYDLNASEDSADLIVCCEVIEHLRNPTLALIKLQDVVKNNLIISVPREPLWSALNIARGKYISTFGNTPGHIQKWTKTGFIQLVGKYFEIIEIRNPIPWTMLLCRKK